MGGTTSGATSATQYMDDCHRYVGCCKRLESQGWQCDSQVAKTILHHEIVGTVIYPSRESTPAPFEFVRTL